MKAVSLELSTTLLFLFVVSSKSANRSVWRDCSILAEIEVDLDFEFKHRAVIL